MRQPSRRLIGRTASGAGRHAETARFDATRPLAKSARCLLIVKVSSLSGACYHRRERRKLWDVPARVSQEEWDERASRTAALLPATCRPYVSKCTFGEVCPVDRIDSTKSTPPAMFALTQRWRPLRGLMASHSSSDT